MSDEVVKEPVEEVEEEEDGEEEDGEDAGGAEGVEGVGSGPFATRGKRKRGGQGKRKNTTLTEGRRRAEGGKPPQKRFFRQRAHVNPLSKNEAFD